MAPDPDSISALTRAVADAVSVPVIASGGVGTSITWPTACSEGHADAVLAASIFHFGEYRIAEGKGAHGQARHRGASMSAPLIEQVTWDERGFGCGIARGTPPSPRSVDDGVDESRIARADFGKLVSLTGSLRKALWEKRARPGSCSNRERDPPRLRWRHAVAHGWSGQVALPVSHRRHNVFFRLRAGWRMGPDGGADERANIARPFALKLR